MTAEQNPCSNPQVRKAMLDSLIDSFEMANATGNLIISMNAGDVAQLLRECRAQQDIFPREVK